MSARARGIIVAGDFGKLVVEASDAEVARFAQHDLVEVGLLDRPQAPSWGRMYASRATVDAWPDMTPDNAVLRTRCGCTRTINVDPGHPPHVFSVPMQDSSLMASLASLADLDALSHVTTTLRRFERRRSRVQANGRIVHEYEEMANP